MLIIEARNVHDALPTALAMLAQGDHTVERDSRNGPVKMFDCPVTTVFEKPCERVLFHPLRDANPFFHLYESLWMLAGRNDVASVMYYVKRMYDFSDDGVTLHGAYGYRWLHTFGFDQLTQIIRALQADHNDRRCVLQMWDASQDLGRRGKDVPCNTQAMFLINANGELDMTVLNRSNDIIMGAYGANAVHFSVLQEYMANCIGVPVGRYWQVSNNFHAYEADYKKVEDIAFEGVTYPYGMKGHPFTPTVDVCVDVTPYPLMQTLPGSWQVDLKLYMEHGPVVGLNDPFFTRVVQPMHHAYRAHKAKNYEAALELASRIEATDWRKACVEWLTRRATKTVVG